MWRLSPTMASERSSPAYGVSAEPAASAAALVVVTTIRRVELSPPATGPANDAWSPWAGGSKTRVTRHG